MNGEQQVGGQSGGDGGRDFEERVRSLLADDALTIRPSAVPYPAIRRRGAVERRRRFAAVGAVLVTLAAAPVGAYALSGADRGVDTASPAVSASATRSPASKPTPTATPSGPKAPATAGQLLDGITLETAKSAVQDCLTADMGPVSSRSDLGEAEDYRILLAMRSTGDSNAPGDGYFVVAARTGDPEHLRVICNIKDGEVSGLNSGGVQTGLPDEGKVVPDINGQKLYSQSVMDRGNWKLPFRWGAIGVVDPSVTEVTVSYGDGEARPAVLDDGWFVAAGELNQQVTRAPHIKGYDAAGELVYDSDDDKYYMADLP
ncbi:hypothetical protein ACWC10_01655 [Streptomyces sp. NPDC001595]|uniref:hypothetical protein n=1 Tax=Streptomyces sp. NPDC001532 TaxID=3154520 RepID=UPI00332A5DBA